MYQFNVISLYIKKKLHNLIILALGREYRKLKLRGYLLSMEGLT
jgi:hypothetical protein